MDYLVQVIRKGSIVQSAQGNTLASVQAWADRAEGGPLTWQDFESHHGANSNHDEERSYEIRVLPDASGVMVLLDPTSVNHSEHDVYVHATPGLGLGVTCRSCGVDLCWNRFDLTWADINRYVKGDTPPMKEKVGRA